MEAIAYSIEYVLNIMKKIVNGSNSAIAFTMLCIFNNFS